MCAIFAIFTSQAWNMALRALMAEFRMPSAAGDWAAQAVRACVIAAAHAI
jgi:ABC-type anion transport system duplicated permease subunit